MNKNPEYLINEEINDDSSRSNCDREGENKKMGSSKCREKQSRLRQRKRERTRIKSEDWEYHQIHKIFTLYGECGSQWKNMQSEFEQRPANSIKNRFYTVIRTFLKLLFRYHPTIINKLPHQIPSKSILKFYESREQFDKFGDFGKRTMKKINYNLNSTQLKLIVLQHLDQIQQIYNLIFNIKEEQVNSLNTPPLMARRPKSEDNPPHLGQENQQLESLYKSNQSIPVDIFKTKAEIDANPPVQQGPAVVSGADSVVPQGYILFFPVFGFYPTGTQNNYFPNNF